MNQLDQTPEEYKESIETLLDENFDLKNKLLICRLIIILSVFIVASLIIFANSKINEVKNCEQRFDNENAARLGEIKYLADPQNQ